MNCSYKKCRNAYWACKKENKDLHFFRFPLDEHICRLWIDMCDRPDLLNKDIRSLHNYRVCSEHFGNEMFMNPNQKTRLLPSAVPQKYGAFLMENLSNASGPSSSRASCVNLESDSATTCATMEHEVKEVLLKEPILQNLVIQPAAEIGVSQGVPTGQTSSVGVQTPRLFSRSTEELRLLKAENSKLKAQLAREKQKNGPLINLKKFVMNFCHQNCLHEIVGVEDNGTERTCFVPATSAAVFMLTGINSKWKQPIGYALSATSLKAVDVKNLLDQFIDKVTSIGLDVVALVTDMGSNFIHLSNMLGVTSENSLVYLGKKQILYYFDPCHLIKAARNNLMTATFKWEEFTASWKDIEMYFAKRPTSIKSHGTQTDSDSFITHQLSKNEIQVLSNTVASAIETYIHFDQLPSEAAGTAQFLRKFDKLFNIFNSLSKNPTSKLDYAFQGDQTQLEFLHNAKSF
ncbi:hypothetical protein NQ317_008731 [Molorchus minor]|uniref:THAP-type domain-containing protein n=1 Tax=Molorchus minor TaxID=1323400 RepID=A0ABQ9ITF1_9CUCU|nr:hypothetical protein NQ317_008731 [Molorchus minor]